MKKILFISATSQTNFTLAKELSFLINKNKFSTNIINVEKLQLPLFNPSTFKVDKKKYYNQIKEMTDSFIESDAFVICAPEYNGNVPPVITNAIAWISTTADYWKDAFKNKNALISSSSGGEAKKFQLSMKNQMEHLGVKVYKENIIIHSKTKNHIKNSKKIVNDFINIL